MHLQQLFQINSHLLLKQQPNHSITQAICRKHLFKPPVDPIKHTQAIQIYLKKDQISPQMIQWLNVFLFNVCALNQELAAGYDDEGLESTEDVPQFSNRRQKQEFVKNKGNAVRSTLKSWLTDILSLPFFVSLLKQSTTLAISRNRQLRGLFQTIDYLMLKYNISSKHRRRLIQLLQGVKQSGIYNEEQGRLALQKIFNGKQGINGLLQQISSNYMIEISEISEVISANYFQLNPSRKIFQKCDQAGFSLIQGIIDNIIKKNGKHQLFTQKMQSNRSFELLVSVLIQREGSLWLQIFNLFSKIISNKTNNLYAIGNHQLIQKIGMLLNFTIPNEYPHLHRLFKYFYSALLGQYSKGDTLELMKKLILNRLLLNPIYHNLFMSPSQDQLHQFITMANQLRILFYQKKTQQLKEVHQVVELGQYLRNSLSSMLASEEARRRDIDIMDRGVYVNDKIIGNLLARLSQQFKLDRPGRSSINKLNFSDKKSQIKQDRPQNNNFKANRSSLNQHSQSSLSFSLRNDSMSRQESISRVGPSHPNVSVAHYHSQRPQLPKPNASKFMPQKQKQIEAERQKQKQLTNASYDSYAKIQQVQQVNILQDLISLRRQYGQMRRNIDQRKQQHQKKRQNWMRQAQILNQNLSQKRQNISVSSNQILINTLIF